MTRSILSSWGTHQDSLMLSTPTYTLKELGTKSSSSTCGLIQLLITTTTPYIGTQLPSCKITSYSTTSLLLYLIAGWFLEASKHNIRPLLFGYCNICLYFIKLAFKNYRYFLINNIIFSLIFLGNNGYQKIFISYPLFLLWEFVIFPNQPSSKISF